MKSIITKLLLITLAIVFLAFSACSNNSNNSVQEQAETDPFLDELITALDYANPDYAYIFVSGAEHNSSLESIRITKGLLQKIGSAILSGNPVRSASVVGASYYSENVFIHLTISNNFALISFNQNAYGQPDRAALSFQIGEERAEYTLDVSAYTKVRELISEHTFFKDLLLVGNYIRCDPALADISGIYSSGLYLEDVLEAGNKLLFLWCHRGSMGEASYWLEDVVPETGAASVVWKYEFTEYQGDDMMLEATDFGEYDYRIKCRSMVVYKNSMNPAAERVFEIPVDITSIESKYVSFDVYPETGQIAYSTEDGVFIRNKGGGIWLLKNSNLEQYVSSTSEMHLPFYTRVHFLNSGKQLVSHIITPYSQSGLAALVVTDMDEGKHTTFDIGLAHVRFMSDTTVAIVSYDQATMIDARSKQTEIIPIIFNAAWTTNDFYNYFDVRQEKDENGTRNGFLILSTVDEPEQEKHLLKIIGENAYLGSVTENYAILICRDHKDSYIALVPVEDFCQ